MTITEEQRKDVLEALDTIGQRLAEHGHIWTISERRQYERAVRLLGGSTSHRAHKGALDDATA